MWSFGSIIILALYKGIRSYDFAKGCPVCAKQIAAILCNESEQNKFCYKHVMWIQDIERLERNYLDKPIDWTLHNVFFDELEQAKVATLDVRTAEYDGVIETLTTGDGGVITVYENGLKTWRRQ
jgi:hypothetical protein